MREKLIFVIAIVIVFLNCRKDNEFASGVIAPEEPIQIDLFDQDSIIIKDYKLFPLAKFDITAKVLSKSIYYFDDFADLIPVDFALGWGRMSDNSILEHFTIFQNSRWFFWTSKKIPIPKKEIISHCANMHLIPATKKIKRQLKRTREGKLVRIQGFLVKVVSVEGFIWKSSLSREDSGAAACELILVNEFIELNNKE